jgi:restriction endonuclease S subunit
LGRSAVVPKDIKKFTLQRSVAVLKPEQKKILPMFLKFLLDSPSIQQYITNNAQGVAQKGIYLKQVGEMKIPLPPIEIQHGIVADLEAEQKLIDANKKLIEIYQKKIKDKLSEIWGE